MSQKMDLNKIFEVASSSDKSDDSKIEVILQQCSKQICVEFAYKVCLDVKHLMKDERSLIAIEAVKQYLDTGKPISREIIDSAAAASSTSYAAFAASVAAASAASSTSSTSSAYYISHTRLEKDKQYLQLL